MIATYGPMFLLLVVAFALSSHNPELSPRTSRYKKPNAEKNAPFEAAVYITGGRLKLSVMFYLTAIIFVVFDIESVFVYPWAIHFRDLGWFGFVEMLGFLTVLVVALAYVWKKGAV